MRPEFASAQRGFGLVAALFLIIAVAGVIAAMARLAVTQHTTSSLALQQARAYQAARAGLEWGTYRFVHTSEDCLSDPEPFLLGVFKVTVQFRREGASFCTVSAAAEHSAPGSPDHVHRKLEVVLEK